MLFRIVFTDLGQENTKSETMGENITFRLNLPLKGMSQREIDIYVIIEKTHFYLKYIFVEYKP